MLCSVYSIFELCLLSLGGDLYEIRIYVIMSRQRINKLKNEEKEILLKIKYEIRKYI